MRKEVYGLCYWPSKGFEIRTKGILSKAGRFLISDKAAATAPRSRYGGGERLDCEARKNPMTWFGVHPSIPWYIEV